MGSVTFPRGFPTRVSLEAFPRGFSTRLSQRAVPRATVVSVDPRRESRGSAGKTGSSGVDRDFWGTREWWHDAGVPPAVPVESASS